MRDVIMVATIVLVSRKLEPHLHHFQVGRKYDAGRHQWQRQLHFAGLYDGQCMSSGGGFCVSTLASQMQ